MSKISELAEATTLSDADMAVIDNITDGSRKFKLKRLKDASDGNATDIDKLQDSMADEYDVNVSYSAGDYAMHEGTLYKATDTTTGAWDSSKWSEAQISDDVKQLNSNLVGSDTIITNGVNIYVNNNKNVVTIQFRGQLGKTATTGSTTNLDVTVPVGKRPSNATYGVLCAGGSTNVFMLVGITTSGAIQIYNHSGSNQNYGYGQITYVI